MSNPFMNSELEVYREQKGGGPEADAPLQQRHDFSLNSSSHR